MKLIKPTIVLKQEYLEMLDEWKQNNEKIVPWVLTEDTSDFQAMISRFADYSQGIGLKEGLVPHSTYWLVRDDNKILGAINIRHRLNDYLKNIGGHIGYGIRPSERRKGYATEMLGKALDIVRGMGIKSIMISCDKDNIASAKTIIKNGGVLHSEDSDNGTIFQRYWIALNQGECL
jgi:predicted acetyltransferase